MATSYSLLLFVKFVLHALVFNYKNISTRDFCNIFNPFKISSIKSYTQLNVLLAILIHMKTLNYNETKYLILMKSIKCIFRSLMNILK